MSSDQILVLGSAGFIGSAIARRLDSTHQLVLAHRPSSPRSFVKPPLASTVVAVDLEDSVAVHGLIETLRPAAVVNCAAAVDFSPLSSVEKLWAINALLPSILSQACSQVDAHLIHLSGSLVHGSRPKSAGTADLLNPDSPYGESKLLGDQMIIASGVGASVLRLPGVFGIDGPAHLGLNRALVAARAGRPIQLSGPGTEKRNYVSAEEVADVVQFVLQSGPTGVAYVGGEVNDIRTYLQVIAQMFGVPLECADGSLGGDALVERDNRLPPAQTFADSIASFVAETRI